MWWTELPIEFWGRAGKGGGACGGRAKDNKGKKTINVSDISRNIDLTAIHRLAGFSPDERVTGSDV